MKKEPINIKGWVYIPESKEDLLSAIHGMDWALTAWDLDQELRSRLKYGHTLGSADEALQWARDTLHELLDHRNLSFNMIS